MAVSAIAAAKIAVAVVSDKRARTLLLSVIAGVFCGLIILCGAIFSVMKGSQESNQRALGYIFNTQPTDIPMWDLPPEYRAELTAAKGRVSSVISAIDGINAKIENEPKIDRLKVGVIYLCLFPNGEITDYTGFIGCFFKKETVNETINAEDGSTEEISREITVAITDETDIYMNIQSKFGLQITTEQYENITATYTFLTTGGIFLAPYDGEIAAPRWLTEPGEAYSDTAFAALMSEATKYIGYPYVFGGSNPKTSFDCSGFVCWVYTQSGVRNLARTTAQGIFNQCAPISKSELKQGDLVFFQGTYSCPDIVTHIGIYVGENKFLHCGNPIGYASLDSTYWTAHWYAAARLIEI